MSYVFWRCKPCLHARAGPQDYILDCPNPDCQNKLTSNCWYLNVPDDEPNVFCCSSCGAKYMKWTGYRKFHKIGEAKKPGPDVIIDSVSVTSLKTQLHESAGLSSTIKLVQETKQFGELRFLKSWSSATE